MSTFKTFNEIDSWTKSRALSSRLFQISNQGKFAKDFGLKDQINRSSGSVMDNIAEGFEREGVREFVHFLAIAKGSIGEVQSQLHRALDRGYISSEEFADLIREATQVGNLIGGLMIYLRRSGFRGKKFENPTP